MPVISDYLFQKASRNATPLSVSFELSPVCNFHCKMCYVRKDPQQLRQQGKTLIPWQQWLSLAQDCRQEGTLFLLLTGGEPFLYPNFRELYEALHDMGFLIAINTNGTLIDEQTLQWLKQRSPYRINLTLYGASESTYQRVCGQADGFARAINALRQLKQCGIPTAINASMIPENAEDLEKILDIGKELQLNTRVGTYMFPPVRREKEDGDSRFTPEVAAKMYMRKQRHLLSDAQLREFFSKQAAENNGPWGTDAEHMRCRAGRCSCWISWEGKMTACGLFPFPLEQNVFAAPFAECWQRLTQRVRAVTVLEKCHSCSLREHCNPCAATVYAECADVNGTPEYLCRMSECVKQEINAFLDVSF